MTSDVTSPPAAWLPWQRVITCAHRTPIHLLQAIRELTVPTRRVHKGVELKAKKSERSLMSAHVQKRFTISEVCVTVSWLAWANDTTAYYAVICRPCQRTAGPAVLHADIPPPQSASLGLRPVDSISYCSFPVPLMLRQVPDVYFLRATAGTAIARLSHRNSVCPSVCLSHGWIRQKRYKLGSSNLHHQLPQRL